MKAKKMLIRTTRSRLAILCLAGFLTACGASNVVIQGNFPSPNITKFPLSIAVYYDDALRGFAFMEESETGRDEINIESGEAHIRLFDAVLPEMFDQVVNLNTLEEAKDQNVDAVFIPAILDFQLALPAKTKLRFTEVWIEYNMQLMTPEGDSIADWVVTSYGRTPQETFRTAEAQINDAAIFALRDLANQFVLEFGQVAEISDWLAIYRTKES